MRVRVVLQEAQGAHYPLPPLRVRVSVRVRVRVGVRIRVRVRVRVRVRCTCRKPPAKMIRSRQPACVA